MRQVKELSGFSNVVADQTATLDLPVDRKYHVLHLGYQAGNPRALANRATIAADIEEIRLLLNGVVQWEFSAAQYIALLDLHGQQIQDGSLPIFLSEPWRRTPTGEIGGAWDLLGSVRTFQLEVKLGGSAVNPRLECHAEYEPGSRSSLGLIKKYTQQQIGVSATGIHTIDSTPGIGVLHGIHCFETAANDIKSVRVELDQKTVYEAPRHIIGAVNSKRDGHPVDKVCSVRFDSTDMLGDFLPNKRSVDGVAMDTDIRLKFDMANPNAFQLLWEYYGEPN